MYVPVSAGTRASATLASFRDRRASSGPASRTCRPASLPQAPVSKRNPRIPAQALPHVLDLSFGHSPITPNARIAGQSIDGAPMRVKQPKLPAGVPHVAGRGEAGRRRASLPGRGARDRSDRPRRHRQERRGLQRARGGGERRKVQRQPRHQRALAKNATRRDARSEYKVRRTTCLFLSPS